MRTIPIALRSLLPIEVALSPRKLCFLGQHFTSSFLSPVVVVPHERKFILGDGRHRSAYLYMRGVSEITADVLEHDAEILHCEKRAFALYRNLVTFIHEYETWWRPECASRGIFSVHDYHPCEFMKAYERSVTAIRAGVTETR